jgi:hypothetical protein
MCVCVCSLSRFFAIGSVVEWRKAFEFAYSIEIDLQVLLEKQCLE